MIGAAGQIALFTIAVAAVLSLAAAPVRAWAPIRIRQARREHRRPDETDVEGHPR